MERGNATCHVLIDNQQYSSIISGRLAAAAAAYHGSIDVSSITVLCVECVRPTNGQQVDSITMSNSAVLVLVTFLSTSSPPVFSTYDHVRVLCAVSMVPIALARSILKANDVSNLRRRSRFGEFSVYLSGTQYPTQPCEQQVSKQFNNAFGASNESHC